MRVIANVAVTLDGRIAPSDGARVALGTPTDRARMHRLRLEADAILVGGATFRAWRLPLVAEPAMMLPLTEPPAVDASRRWLNVVLTRGGELPTDARFWDDPRVDPLVLSGVEGAQPRGERVVRADWGPAAVMAELATRGVRTLLLEGGAGVLGPFLAAGVVDELFVTLCPRLLGAGLSVVPELPGCPATMRLRSCEAVGDEVFLRYGVGG